MLTDLHKHLLNDFQRDFPLSARPYQDIADALGATEDEVLTALSDSTIQQFISRIGPVIRPNHIGVSTLVAMAVPEAHLQSVANKISAYPEVNHNYEREHRFNLWFVAMASDVGHLSHFIEKVEQETGYKTMQLPLVNDFFIDLGFKLDLRYA
ncbi:MAG: Lrp/AsnC family transcriptional regulator [Methylovulum sp.]|nr:Lrp/AsnC family transcriptional regulator [Methylovulum sp.]